MQISRYIFVLLIICAAILCAGCTQNPSSPATLTPVAVPVTPADPAQYALVQSDMPPGFVLAESRTKTSADLSTVAMELGWQGGHVVRFVRPAQNKTAASEIVQTVTLYPAKNIPDIIAMAEKQGRSPAGMSYTDIPVAGLGNNARAFSGQTGSLVFVKPTDANPVMAGVNKNEAPAVSPGNFTEILFSKGDTFEVFVMTGDSPDAALLADLAKTAYAKIP